MYKRQVIISKHIEIVGETLGEHIQSTFVTRGIAGGPGIPAEQCCTHYCNPSV